MSTTAAVTEWELRLRDYASGAFKKLTDYATGSQKKLNEVANGLDRAARSSNAMGRDFKRSYSGLESTLAGLEKRQKEAFSTRHILAYQKMIDRTKAEMEQLNAVTKPKGWEGFKTNLKQGVQEMPGFGLLTNPAMLIGAGIVAVGTGIKKSIDLALDWETGMAKINGTAQLGEKNLGRLSDRLLELSSKSGGNFDRITSAYEKILSVTGNINQSLDVMEGSIKGAKAGFADIDVVGEALARTMSALGDKSPEANKLLDVFMMAKNVGAGEFKDFSQYMPGLIASAGVIGYSYKDAVGLYTTLTKTFDPANAAMYAQNVLTAFSKTNILKSLEKGDKAHGIKGIDVFDAQGNRRGLEAVLMDIARLKKAMNPEQFTHWMREIGLIDAQAKIGIGALTGNVENLTTVFNGLANAAGEADRQLNKTANRARNWGDISDKLKSWGVAIGNFLLPAVDSLINLLDKAAEGWKRLLTWDFKSPDRKAQEQYIQQNRIANNIATASLSKWAGKDMSHTDLIPGSKEDIFWRKQKETALDALRKAGSKNNIVKESAAESALKNVNAGKPVGDITGSYGKDTEAKVSGDGSKIRNLTMNLQITNMFKVDDGNHLEKVKQKIADVIVDAARDGMVTVGV